MKSLLISLLSIFFFSCSSYQKKNNYISSESKVSLIKNSYFSDSTIDYVYRAKINIYKNTFSGIFIVKKISEIEHRVVFTTEMGSKIFDFSYKGDDFTVNYVLEEIDKKILINILKKDFRVLIADKLFVNKEFRNKDSIILQGFIYDKKHYYTYINDQLIKIVKSGSKNEKVRFSFLKINDNIANSIEITHQNIKLNIFLKKI